MLCLLDAPLQQAHKNVFNSYILSVEIQQTTDWWYLFLFFPEIYTSAVFNIVSVSNALNGYCI